MRTVLTAAAALVLACLLAVAGPQAASAMPLHVEIDGAASVTLEVESSDSVQQVKQRIEDQTGIPAGDQELLAGGLRLTDGRTLGDYDLQPGDAVTLVVAPAWTDTGLATPVLDEPYDDAVAASGGSMAYSISNGQLPDGLLLDGATGALSGTPTTPGSYAFTVSATNPAGTIAYEASGEIAPAAPTTTPPTSTPPATSPPGTAPPTAPPATSTPPGATRPGDTTTPTDAPDADATATADASAPGDPGASETGSTDAGGQNRDGALDGTGGAPWSTAGAIAAAIAAIVFGTGSVLWFRRGRTR